MAHTHSSFSLLVGCTPLWVVITVISIGIESNSIRQQQQEKRRREKEEGFKPSSSSSSSLFFLWTRRFIFLLRSGSMIYHRWGKVFLFFFITTAAAAAAVPPYNDYCFNRIFHFFLYRYTQEKRERERGYIESSSKVFFFGGRVGVGRGYQHSQKKEEGGSISKCYFFVCVCGFWFEWEKPRQIE